jgi:YidC/Oxa1 family membrane protein insertase
VVNETGNSTVTLHPYGLVSRHGMPDIVGFFILHEGLIGVLGEDGLQEISYSSLDGGDRAFPRGRGRLARHHRQILGHRAGSRPGAAPRCPLLVGPVGDRPTFQTDFLLGGTQIAPGGEASSTSRVFAGAKEVEIIDGYEAAYGIDRFELLIDWGWFYFITKPLFI